VLAIPVAAATGHLSVWLILLVIPMLYFVNGFVYPAQNAVLPQIVEKEDLTRANSLFSTSVRTVDMVANAIGGALIAVIGAVTLFFVNSVTFFIAGILFGGVSMPESSTEENEVNRETNENETDVNEGGYVAEFLQGINYIRGSALPAILFGIMVTNFAATAMTAVLPAFADSIAGPAIYGLLMAAIGAGTLVGTGIAFLVEDYSLSWMAVTLNLATGLLLLVAVAAPSVWITGTFLFLSSVPLGTFNVLFFSMVQSGLDSAYLGRVTSVMRTFLSGISPVGGLLGGSIASVVGSRMAMYGVGGTFAIIGIYYFLHPRVRSLPSVTEADEAALKVGTVTD
jgi:MFS family permease